MVDKQGRGKRERRRDRAERAGRHKPPSAHTPSSTTAIALAEGAPGASVNDDDLRSRVGPGPLVLLGLFSIVVFVGWKAAPYVVDPERAPGVWRTVIAWVLGIGVGLALSTLTTLIYALAYGRDTAEVQKFYRRVGEFTAVGAALGTLSGVRAIAAFRAWSIESGNGSPQLTDVLSAVGNTATVGTLLLVGLCWPWAIPASFEAVRATRRKAFGERPEKEGRWVVLLFSCLMIIGANHAGMAAGYATWNIVMGR